ncbi:MAG TPA: hypothetical protein VEU11_01285 [Terriglobales bacterium]|nr:hypothetical protein [Terriglobales bacterium]
MAQFELDIYASGCVALSNVKEKMTKNREESKPMSITDFGAKPDDVTDNAPALERAIELALQLERSYDASSVGISL